MRPSRGVRRRRARAGWWRCHAWVASITNTSGVQREPIGRISGRHNFVAAVRRALAERPVHRAPESVGRLRILVVGGDVGVRAALALVLSTDYVVDVVPSVRNVPPTMRPDLLLFGEPATGKATLAAMVRDRAQLYLTLTAPLEFSRLQ